jgi:hypothetical protein
MTMHFRLTLNGAPVTDWTEMEPKDATPWRRTIADKENVHPSSLEFQFEDRPAKKAATTSKATKAAVSEKGDDA